ncbi:peroxisome assembly protein (Peroxin-2) [Coemansia sp. RSA 1694]|nr:peroxisome assembly protein (Peroxin-2) [Coemansia sp. RSA 25]KAJ2506112.1 peroxisome assembly protein (Peroxin-2) [Coemansia sp. RSA 2052]KAJ2556409.1 peroxisome assembly protein (Peroxin-2) [Coemansia sp. RSA 1836]KAJ2642233.1 peroxisome assembly protein (Peroxin-2) [Coemansia sp. RSA 1694]
MSELPQEAPQQRWKPAWAATEARIRDSAGRTAVRTAVPRNSRVSKLDADLLDDELTDMLREPVSKAMSLLRPQLVDKHRLEIDTAIRAVLFWLSAGSASRRATYGQSLQNLTYESGGQRDVLRRLRMFGALSIGGAYAWSKLTSYMSMSGWADAPQGSMRRKVWRVLDRLERATRVATLLNFLAFVATGQYKTLLERLLGLRLVYARPQVTHSVSFEFLNRQLVWHAFTEFVMFALPLVNPARARRWAVRNVRTVLGLPSVTIDPAVAALPEHVCAICYSTEAASTSLSPDSAAGAFADPAEACAAVNPYAARCGHRYCYICIQTRMMAEADECTCLRCGQHIDRIWQQI